MQPGFANLFSSQAPRTSSNSSASNQLSSDHQPPAPRRQPLKKPVVKYDNDGEYSVSNESENEYSFYMSESGKLKESKQPPKKPIVEAPTALPPKPPPPKAQAPLLDKFKHMNPLAGRPQKAPVAQLPKEDPYKQETTIMREEESYYDEEEEEESEESIEEFDTESFRELDRGVRKDCNKHLLDGGPNSQFGQTHAQKLSQLAYISNHAKVLKRYSDLASTIGRDAKESDPIMAYLYRLRDARDIFIENTVLIFYNLLDYGFTNSKKGQAALAQKKSMIAKFADRLSPTEEALMMANLSKAQAQNSTETGERQEENPYFDNVFHFWQFISKKCAFLDSVRFLNFHQDTEEKCSGLGLRWIIVALYDTEDLWSCMREIFSDVNFMLLYSMNDSYIWQCKREIMNAIELLRGQDLFTSSQLLKQYSAYKQQRRQQKEAKLAVLDTSFKPNQEQRNPESDENPFRQIQPIDESGFMAPENRVSDLQANQNMLTGNDASFQDRRDQVNLSHVQVQPGLPQPPSKRRNSAHNLSLGISFANEEGSFAVDKDQRQLQESSRRHSSNRLSKSFEHQNSQDICPMKNESSESEEVAFQPEASSGISDTEIERRGNERLNLFGDNDPISSGGQALNPVTHEVDSADYFSRKGRSLASGHFHHSPLLSYGIDREGSPSKEGFEWPRSKEGTSSRDMFSAQGKPSITSGVEEAKIEIGSFHRPNFEHHQDLRSPGFDEQFLGNQAPEISHIMNQGQIPDESFDFFPKQHETPKASPLDTELKPMNSPFSPPANLFGSSSPIRADRQVMRVPTFGFCLTPSRTDMAKTIFLDGNCNQYRFADSQIPPKKSEWGFIDHRNRRNYRLLVKSESGFHDFSKKLHRPPTVSEDLASMEENFKFYCFLHNIKINSDRFHNELLKLKVQLLKEHKERPEAPPQLPMMSVMELRNSDMVFNNEFQRRLLRQKDFNQVFTNEKKEAWKMNKKLQWLKKCKQQQVPFAPLNTDEKCSLCFEAFYQPRWPLSASSVGWVTENFGGIKNKFFCLFCSEHHCRKCMIQTEFEMEILQEELQQSVCEEAFTSNLAKASGIPLRNKGIDDSDFEFDEPKNIITSKFGEDSGWRDVLFFPGQIQFQLTTQDLMGDVKVLQSSEFKEENEGYYICKRAFIFQARFKYVRLSTRNPLVSINPKLRAFLKLRRSVHKLFDLIKCQFWEKLFENGHPFLQINKFRTIKAKDGDSSRPQPKLVSFKNLILREAIVSFEQLQDIEHTTYVLLQLKNILVNHIEIQCQRCDYNEGEECQFCCRGKKVRIYEVETAGTCPKCFLKGHRACLEAHQC